MTLNDKNISLILGALTVTGLYRLNSFIKSYKKEKSLEMESNPSSDSLSLQSKGIYRGITIKDWTEKDYKQFETEVALFLLSFTDNYLIRTRSEKALLLRVVSDSTIQVLLVAISIPYNSELKSTSMSILRMLSEDGDFAETLFIPRVYNVLLKKIGNSFEIDDLDTQALSSAILINLFIFSNFKSVDAFSTTVIDKDNLSSIISVFNNSSIYNFELVYNLIKLIYLISDKEEYRPLLFESNLSISIINLLKSFSSNSKVTEKLLEILLRMVENSDSSNKEKEDQSQTLIQMGLMPLLASHLYSDNFTHVSISISLIQHLIAQGLGIEELLKVPKLVKILCHNIHVDIKSYLNVLILRILWHLLTEKSDNNTVYFDTVEPSTFVRILSLFLFKSHELCYWILSILTKVSSDLDTHSWIISSPMFKCISYLLEKESHYNFHIRILMSMVISNLFNSKLVYMVVKKIPHLDHVFRLLVQSDSPEVILNMSSSIIGLCVISVVLIQEYYFIDEAGPANYFQPFLNKLFKILLDKNLENLHLHTLKNLASLVSLGVFKFDFVSKNAAMPFLKSCHLDTCVLLNSMIKDLNLCQSNSQRSSELIAAHTKPRKLTKAITRNISYIEALPFVFSFYKEEPSDDSVDLVVQKKTVCDPVVLETIKLLLNSSAVILGILNLIYFLGDEAEDSVDYEPLSKLHSIIKDCKNKFPTGREHNSCSMYVFDSIIGYLKTSELYEKSDKELKTFLYKDLDMKIQKKTIVPEKDCVDSIKRWALKMKQNRDSTEISEWLQHLHLTTEIGLLHTAIYSMSILFSFSFNDEKYELIPNIFDFVIILFKSPFLSRGSELKLIQSLPADRLTQSQYDTLMKICMYYSKICKQIVPPASFLLSKSDLSRGAEKIGSESRFSNMPLNPASQEKNFFLETFSECQITPSVDMVLRLRSPFSSYFLSKAVTAIVSDSILMQFISSNQSAFSNNLAKPIKYNLINFGSLEESLSNSGWSFKQSSHIFSSDTSVVNRIDLVSNSRLFNDSWEFISLTSVQPVTSGCGRHSYSVLLYTSGLMQIGWCTDQCKFYPICGKGIGDNFESLSYDGYRRRRWFGHSSNNNYGEKWNAGDIITSVLDLDNNTVEFFHNGKSMGIAFGPGATNKVSNFNKIPFGRKWYPAVSLTKCQAMEFLSYNPESTDPPLSSKYSKNPIPTFSLKNNISGKLTSHIRFMYGTENKFNISYSKLPLVYCRIPQSFDYIILVLLPDILKSDQMYVRKTNSSSIHDSHCWYLVVLESLLEDVKASDIQRSVDRIFDASSLNNSESLEHFPNITSDNSLNLSKVPFSQIYRLGLTTGLMAEWITFDVCREIQKINVYIKDRAVATGALSEVSNSDPEGNLDESEYLSMLPPDLPFIWHSENIFSFETIH
ncbi:hypothetical protein BB560_007052 [Smittium megazygosporum]|uniref:B30.2/SPRY domain-containing protein n=1 Tax=Smittium megazygosporum TaxID=133381 RepID=A0A2T9XZ64_9FUNG|nr:hypothetical protein BB560_007052 [Smittium megazygosporum]